VRNVSAHNDDDELSFFFFFSLVCFVVVFFFFALSMALTASKCARNLRVSSSVAHVVIGRIRWCMSVIIIIVRFLRGASSSKLFLPKSTTCFCDTTDDGEREKMLLFVLVENGRRRLILFIIINAFNRVSNWNTMSLRIRTLIMLDDFRMMIS